MPAVWAEQAVTKEGAANAVDCLRLQVHQEGWGWATPLMGLLLYPSLGRGPSGATAGSIQAVASADSNAKAAGGQLVSSQGAGRCCPMLLHALCQVPAGLVFPAWAGQALLYAENTPCPPCRNSAALLGVAPYHLLQEANPAVPLLQDPQQPGSGQRAGLSTLHLWVPTTWHSA